MSKETRSPLRIVAIAVTTAGLAACTKAPLPPPPPPPPPPQVAAVPYRPLPPSGASYVMTIPQRGADGARRTVNYGLDQKETVWHFRSGWNVAALNCVGPEYQPIVDAYGAFLKKHQRTLAQANAAIDKEYRDQEGSSRAGLRAREAHMTQVYNYFALPPARERLCGTALAIAKDALVAPPEDATTFAATHLPVFEAGFEEFFSAYERYQLDSAEWDRNYGRQYGASQPGYVAVYGASGAVPASSLSGTPASVVGEVRDPTSGANIPVTATPVDEYATPVVQPVASGE